MTRMFRSMLVLAPLLATSALASSPASHQSHTVDSEVLSVEPVQAGASALVLLSDASDPSKVRDAWRAADRGERSELVARLAVELGRVQSEAHRVRIVGQLHEAAPALGARVARAAGIRPAPAAAERLSAHR